MSCQQCGKPLSHTFQLIPRLPLKPGHLRPPAESLNFIPFGVGGWLALLVISIIVFRPISFSYRAFSELRLLKLGGLEPYGPALDRGIDAAICLALAASGIFTGWHLLGLHRNARKIAEIYIVATRSYYAAGYLLVRMSNAACYLAYGGTAFTVDAVIGSCLWAILWIAYLRRSKRVANTYGAVTFTSLA